MALILSQNPNPNPWHRIVTSSQASSISYTIRDRVMAEMTPLPGDPQSSKLWKWVFAVAGIMTTLVTYGVLQEKIMRVSYGNDKAFFKYLLFLIFCNRITTSAVFAGVLWARKKALDLIAPV